MKSDKILVTDAGVPIGMVRPPKTIAGSYFTYIAPTKIEDMDLTEAGAALTETTADVVPKVLFKLVEVGAMRRGTIHRGYIAELVEGSQFLRDLDKRDFLFLAETDLVIK